MRTVPHIFAEKETETKTILLQVSQVKRTPTITPTTRAYWPWMLFIRNLSTKIKTLLPFLKNIACWNAEMNLKCTTVTRFNFQMIILLKESPLSLKTMEVQIKGDWWNKRFRTVQVYWKNLAGYASQNIVTTVTLLHIVLSVLAFVRLTKIYTFWLDC